MLTITLETYNENIIEISEFLQMINFITKFGKRTLFGGIVRDLIVPMSEIKNSKLTLNNFYKMLKEIKTITLSDIDVLYIGSFDEYTDKNEFLFGTLNKMGWKVKELTNSDEHKDLIENSARTFEHGEYSGMKVKRYHFYNLITDITIPVDFVVVEKKYMLPIDFNVNNLTWCYSEGFGLASYVYFEENYFLTYDRCKQLEISEVIDCIKKKICKMLPLFRFRDKGNMRRVEKIQSKGFFIEGFGKIFRNSYEGVDVADKKCLICLSDLEEGDNSVTICGSSHFVHWTCGKKWWDTKKFNCVLCKGNSLFS